MLARIARPAYIQSRPLNMAIGARCLHSSRFAWSGHDKDIEVADTPPSSWYTDPEFLTRVEKNHTFSGWTYAGRVEQVKQPNNYIANTLMGNPYVIINQAGVPKRRSRKSSSEENECSRPFKAFYNICRHHAAQILDDGQGSLQGGRMVCPYHGWEYTADGRLAKAVKMKGCKNFEPKNYGLVPITVDHLGPWLFVNSDPDSSGSIVEDQPDMHKFWEILEDSGVNELQHVAHRRYRLDCNWKVFIDNYLDGGYHVPIAHPGLSANLALDSYKNVASENYFLQQSASLNQDDSRFNTGQDAVYIWHFPNLCVNRYGDWMDTNVVWPISADECWVDFDWYTTAEVAQDADAVAAALADSDQVQQEDISLCARVQAGLQSWGFRTGRYAPQLEMGELMFHRKLYQDLQKAGM